MGATTPLTGAVNGSSAIATTLTSPTIGTQVNAEDVQTGEQTLLNNDTTFLDGSPTVHGCWTFDGSMPSTSTAPTIIADRGITCTGWHTNSTAGAGITATGGSNGTQGGQGAIITGGAGPNGGAGATIVAGSGSGQQGILAQGDGSAPGVLGQGGATGNGVVGTGGTGPGHGVVGVGGSGNGHGVVGTAGGSGGSGIKGVAAAQADVALWANGGGIFVDTPTPGASPGPNMIYKDKLIAAKAVASFSAGSSSAATVNCTVAVNADTTKADVTFDTNMANTNYTVHLTADEYNNGTSVVPVIPCVVTGSRGVGGFSFRVYNTSNTAATLSGFAGGGTITIHICVVGDQ